VSASTVSCSYSHNKQRVLLRQLTWTGYFML